MNIMLMMNYLCQIITLLASVIESFQVLVKPLITPIGTAIDINPLYNPYVTNNGISPVSGTLYADRNIDCKYQINQNDALYKIFINHGWSWGGNWSKSKDYQHFEKKIF